MTQIIPNTQAVPQIIGSSPVIINGSNHNWIPGQIMHGVKVLHVGDYSFSAEETGSGAAELKITLQRDLGSGWEDQPGEVSGMTFAPGQDRRFRVLCKVPYYSGVVFGVLPKYRLVAECLTGQVILHSAEGVDAVPSGQWKAEYEFEGEAETVDFLPSTGVSTCYDGSGAIIACAGSGQDAETQNGVSWPTPRFTANGDGTVTDNLTGLIWLENASAVPAGTWDSALAAAATAADGVFGLSDGSSLGDWRLPNVNEMSSLLAVEFSSPSISNGEGTDRHGDSGTSVFTGIVNNNYWSSTTYSNGPFDKAWVINLASTNIDVSVIKTQPAQAWLVKDGVSAGVIDLPATGQFACYDGGSIVPCSGTGQDAEFLKGIALPEPRFQDNGDGTVTDNLTGLIWTKDAESGPITNWDGALAAAATAADGVFGLSDGSSLGDWRLPNVNEFRSLVNYHYLNLSMSDAAGTGHQDLFIPASLVFQNFGNGYTTWASNTYPLATNNSMSFQGLTGVIRAGGKNNPGAVWLVRDA
jgi:hypothetical protein